MLGWRWSSALLTGFVIASAVGAFARSARLQAVLAAACAAGLLSLGFLALFSIGLVLMAAGAIALLAWGKAVRNSDGGRVGAWSAVAAIATIGIMAIGFVATG